MQFTDDSIPCGLALFYTVTTQSTNRMQVDKLPAHFGNKL